ncbi:MAG: hypothetical protein JRJ38_17915 [Deltaproteobacteria bacterium]|nr:hypothetical protein [Deltaproteobacteria bacterium]
MPATDPPRYGHSLAQTGIASIEIVVAVSRQGGLPYRAGTDVHRQSVRLGQPNRLCSRFAKDVLLHNSNLAIILRILPEGPPARRAYASESMT